VAPWKRCALFQITPENSRFLKKAIDLSLDAHFEAMKMMRPGPLYEYPGRREQDGRSSTLWGGSEAEGYRLPIVGAGVPTPRLLHYDKLARKIADGDIVGSRRWRAKFSGYSADITRALPANGKFTPRQREIYDVVFGSARKCRLRRRLKPGMNFLQVRATTVSYKNFLRLYQFPRQGICHGKKAWPILYFTASATTSA